MDGTTVVITGASRGIGAAVARAFADEGATVVCGSRSADEIEAVAEDIRSSGGDAIALRTDVRDEFDLERLMETAARSGGDGIDIVVACAGIYHGSAGETPLLDESYAAFDDAVQTNARGVFGTVKEALPHLNDGARILVPTGAVARKSIAGYGVYAVSKAAVEGIIRGFAADGLESGNATGGRVVIGGVDPGQVATELTGGEGRDPTEVTGLFLWAATDADADDLDGNVVGLGEWKTATSA